MAIASSIVCGQGCRCGIWLSLQPFSSNLNLFCDFFKLIFIVGRDKFCLAPDAIASIPKIISLVQHLKHLLINLNKAEDALVDAS
jgi:hypothetical protein